MFVSAAGGRPFGQSRDVPFALVARSLDAAAFVAPVNATYTLTPSWPTWLAGIGVPLLFGAGAVLAAIIGLLWYFDILKLPGSTSANTTPSPDGAVTSSASAVGTAPTGGPTPSLEPTPIITIQQFSATPDQVVYQTQGFIVLAWDVEGGVRDVALYAPGDIPIPLTADNISTGRYQHTIDLLARGENTFELTVTGQDGQPRTDTVTVIVAVHECTVPSNSRALTEPNSEADLAPTFTSNQVIIVGRTVDLAWVRIAYNDLQSLVTRGWLPASEVTCDSTSPPLETYVTVLDGSGFGPVPTP